MYVGMADLIVKIVIELSGAQHEEVVDGCISAVTHCRNVYFILVP